MIVVQVMLVRCVIYVCNVVVIVEGIVELASYSIWRARSEI